MNNNMLNHPQNTPCLSSQEMLDYTQGILSTQEQHRIEKHLLDCEFCSDSLEGIQLMKNPNSLLSIEEELNLEIDFKGVDHLMLGLYSSTGQLIKQLKLDEIEGAMTKKYTFDFLYPAGIYFINLHTNTGRQSVKVVK